MKFLYEKFGETNINHYLCTRKSETKSHNAKCGYDAIQTIGEMAEWSNAPVLKTGVLRGTGGSNPSLSAKVSVTSCKTTSYADFYLYTSDKLRTFFKSTAVNNTCLSRQSQHCQKHKEAALLQLGQV